MPPEMGRGLRDAQHARGVACIGADSVLHLLLDANVIGKFENLIVVAPTLNGMLTYEESQICATQSVLAVPEVRANDNQAIGMAIAKAASIQSVPVALQTQLGYQPERLKIALLSEDGVIKMYVSGASPGGWIETPPIQEPLIRQKGESVASLVHRAALFGMSRIDP
jgi:hypothetical protein